MKKNLNVFLLGALAIIILAIAGAYAWYGRQKTETNACQIDADCQLIAKSLPGQLCCPDCRAEAVSRSEWQRRQDWQEQNCQAEDYAACRVWDCYLGDKEAVCVNQRCELKIDPEKAQPNPMVK